MKIIIVITIGKVNHMQNEKGVIALAVILSMLLVFSALAVFGVVSGRFGISYHLNNRIQALRDAETASFVTYQLMRDGVWDTPADRAIAGTPETHQITINGKTMDISVESDSTNSVKAKVAY